MVLLVLLLSVPLQLLLTYNFTQKGVPNEDGGDIERIRLDGVTRQDLIVALNRT